MIILYDVIFQTTSQVHASNGMLRHSLGRGVFFSLQHFIAPSRHRREVIRAVITKKIENGGKK